MNSTEKLPIEFRIAQLEANLENELRLSGAAEDRISAAESTILREKAAIVHSNKTIAMSIERSKQIEAALEVLRMKQAATPPDAERPTQFAAVLADGVQSQMQAEYREPRISDATRVALLRLMANPPTQEVGLAAGAVDRVGTIEALRQDGVSLLHALLREAREILLEARHAASSEAQYPAGDIITDLARASLLEPLASDSGLVDGVPVPMTIAVVDGAVYDLGLIDGID